MAYSRRVWPQGVMTSRPSPEKHAGRRLICPPCIILVSLHFESLQVRLGDGEATNDRVTEL